MVRIHEDAAFRERSFADYPGNNFVRADEGHKWFFHRFGMSRTRMPDGRVICIAGEHEDYYDPDFCIYNDVVVLKPGAGQRSVTETNGDIEFYDYPFEVFPPTDFHSATLVGDKIYLIGSLGYLSSRRKDFTPVFLLDTQTYRITELQTHGEFPGWIYDHHASFDEPNNAIIVRGGYFDSDSRSKIERSNTTAYRLRLDSLEWELVDPEDQHSRYLISQSPELEARPEWDHPTTFRPSRVAHRLLETCPIFFDVAIEVSGVRVMLEGSFSEVKMLIEGELPRDTQQQLIQEILNNLRDHRGGQWRVEEVESFRHEQPFK